MIKRKGRLGSVLIFALGVASAFASDRRQSRVDALFHDWIGPGSPGCAVGVIRDGGFLYRNAYGMASLEYDVPLSSRSVFRTGSVGKQFTAFAVLLAQQQGKLSVDDDIRKYLPELPVTPEVITISNLIHHTSGIRDYLMLMSLAGSRDEDFYTDEDVLARLSRQENLNFPPGTEYLYSNSGYFLLSQIILRATGEKLREFARKNIFEPLSMESTHFHDDFRMVVKDRAEGYRPKKDGGFEIDRTTLNMVGDGGVYTTIDDLLRWDENFDAGTVGGSGLATKRLATGRLKDGTPETYAFGLRIGSHRGRRTASHGGSFVGYRAATLRFPDDRFSVYLLCNRSDAEPEALALQVADIFLFEDTGGETAASPETVLSETDSRALCRRLLRRGHRGADTARTLRGLPRARGSGAEARSFFTHGVPRLARRHRDESPFRNDVGGRVAHARRLRWTAPVHLRARRPGPSRTRDAGALSGALSLPGARRHLSARARRQGRPAAGESGRKVPARARLRGRFPMEGRKPRLRARSRGTYLGVRARRRPGEKLRLRPALALPGVGSNRMKGGRENP